MPTGSLILEIVLAVAVGSLVGWLVASWRSRPQLPASSAYADSDRLQSPEALSLSAHLSTSSQAPSFHWYHLGAEIVSSILDVVSEGVLVLDAQRAVIAANASATKLLGFSERDLLGRKFWELVPYRPLLDALEHVALGATVTAEVPLRHPRDRLLRFHVRSVPALLARTSEAEPVPLQSPPSTARSALMSQLLIVILQEITELRRLEQYRREFLANVSHELKTPLAAIQAAAETLQSGAVHDPPAALRFLQHILDNAERLHRLIQDMLQLARIEAGQQRWHRESVPVADVVRNVLQRHQARAEQKGLLLHIEPPHEPIAAWVDAEALTRILENLLDNAIKYTHHGGITVRWRRENHEVVLEIQDSGEGIPPEHLPRVFERFYRVDKSRQPGGSGLGLAIVKHLVQAMDGSISVCSQPGSGSLFTVRLPSTQLTN